MTARGKVAVTGGSGKVGVWVIRELLDHGYDVLNLDVRPLEDSACHTLIVDLNDLGQVHNALGSYGSHKGGQVEAVIHLGALPRPYIQTNEVTFRNNVMSTYNVLEACANLGIGRAVIASSESAYGYVFAREFAGPIYVPVDEDHPLQPEDSYGLSKSVNELTGEMFYRRTGMQVIALRLGNIIAPDEHAKVRETFDDPLRRQRILWSYLDARDAASACRLAIERDGLGYAALNLAAEDTSSSRSTGELVREYLPGSVEMRLAGDGSGRDALLSSERAKTLLGWRQQFFLQENAEY